MVVAVDVGADHLAGLLEGLELLAPDAALLELGEPGLDEGLALGVAVAAATMDDAVLSEPGAERAGGQRGAVVGTRASARRAGSAGPRTAVSTTAAASTARQRTSSAQPVISRVQQSIAAFR